MTAAIGWSMNTVPEKFHKKSHLQHAKSMHEYKWNQWMLQKLETNKETRFITQQ